MATDDRRQDEHLEDDARTTGESGRAWIEVVYDDLRALASHHLSGERTGHTLRATDLVHEAWMRLSRYERMTLRGRNHFLALASQAMRRILVDHARKHLASKRGGGMFAIELSDQLEAISAESFIELDAALVSFAAIDPETAAMVEQRFFGGARILEIAEAFDVSERTVRNRLAYARAWLRDALE